MIGKEIADILMPFVKWGAVVSGFLFICWYVYRQATSGAVAKDDLAEAETAQREKDDARHAVEREADSDLSKFDREWLRDDKGE